MYSAYNFLARKSINIKTNIYFSFIVRIVDKQVFIHNCKGFFNSILDLELKFIVLYNKTVPEKHHHLPGLKLENILR